MPSVSYSPPPASSPTPASRTATPPSSASATSVRATPSPIPGWEALGEAARNPADLAFFDNGAAPDGKFVVALQNRVTLRQPVGPFQRDRVYRLRLQASGRASDQVIGHYGRLEVRLNGTPLVWPFEVAPVDAPGRHEKPFQTLEALFIPGDGKYLLELLQVDPADGISVLVDNVRIEPVDEPATQAVRINRARARPVGRPVTEVDFRRTTWIWSPEEADPLQAAPAGVRHFRRTFRVANPAGVKRAFFVASADNSADVFVNGTFCGTAPSFGDWYEMDFRDNLRAGQNVIAVRAVNAGERLNPAGLAGVALLLGEGGKVLQALGTDTQWRTSPAEAPGWQAPAFDDSAWRPAVVLGRVGCPPWGNVGFLTWLVPPDFPTFTVPGQTRYMELLRQLFWLHHPGSGPKATMWDPWLTMSSLWPSTGPAPGASEFRAQWRSELLKRPIDHEGYVSTIQHHGFGHGEGWPFPTAQQAGGVVWQFASEHTAYRVAPVRTLDGWTLDGLTVEGLDPTVGLRLRVTGDAASLTTPGFDIDRYVAPFVRLEWETHCREGAGATLEWTTPEHPEFGPARSVDLPLTADNSGRPFTDVPLYRHPDPGSRLTRLRLTVNGASGGTLRILGLITAPDTRHPVNNPNYLQGCTEYFTWTGDLGFLRQNLPRMRAALEFALREFRVEQEGGVFVPWVGHDGRSGLTLHADGTKTIHPGRGIGANYWDLLPFSGHDCLATIYLYDALRRMAALEAAVAAHPEWKLAPPAFPAARLSALADTVKRRSGQRFWSRATGRFVACVDTDGVAHDYGYTFVNTEAVYYGFATPPQAKAIVDWLDGRRIVPGDTSTGADIYRWRFGPRATTRRNVEWYDFVWSGPEGIPWGGQVQDGGAVLGFAFHDQMARLLSAGPDNAWAKLRQTLDWFADVRAAGGYRSYYAVPGRGTLQGGGPPGGLGMDAEFFESALVPQIMLYGFLGFRPEPGGFRLNPKLPRAWPELKLDRIQYRGTVFEIAATHDRVRVTCRGGEPEKARVVLPAGWTGGASVVLGDGRTIEGRRR
ncbi:MAG: hypothetical protein HYU66_04210 [Armatimonadetes bacterium]|nr:hypothetical protein [Armatimonadota bacterium]